MFASISSQEIFFSIYVTVHTSKVALKRTSCEQPITKRNCDLSNFFVRSKTLKLSVESIENQDMYFLSTQNKF